MKPYLLTAALLLPGLCQAQELALTSEGYRALALKNNRELRQAALQARAADQAAKAVFTNYFPKLSAAGVAANTNILPDSALSIPIVSAMVPLADQENDIALSMVTVQQPLFAGGRIHNGNRLANAGRDAARQQLRIKTNEITAGAEKRYRTMQVLNGKKKTLEAYSLLLNSLSTQVEQAFANGLVTKTDVLRVNLKKAEVEVNRATLDKGLALAQKDLRIFAELPADTALLLPDNEETIIVPTETEAELSAALSGRPEYRLLEIGAKAARLQKNIKAGGYLPTVAVGASLYRVDYFKNGDNRYQNSAAFAVVNVPLNWWEGAHAVKELALRQNAAEDRLKETGQYLLLDLEDKLKDYDDAYRKVKLAELAVEESAANRSEKNDGYKNGTEKLSDLLEALALEQQSADALTTAKAAYFQKRTEFLSAAGKRAEDKTQQQQDKGERNK